MMRGGWLLLCAALAGATSGCLGRTLTTFEDHPTRDVVLLETIDTREYFGLYASAEHRFWICAQEETRLVCRPSCGGSRALTCPGVDSTGWTNSR